jgi:hypothetical protein
MVKETLIEVDCYRDSILSINNFFCAFPMPIFPTVML